MEGFKEFLGSSSIHGLSYIGGTKSRLVQFIWIVIVVAGFSAAGKIIYDSFQSWEDSPIVSSVKSRSISKMKFPVVTICPPEDTNTALNNDLMELEGKTLDEATRSNMTRCLLTLCIRKHMKNI